MFTVKLVKYDRSGPEGAPRAIQLIALREASAVFLDVEADGRQVLQLGAAPSDVERLPVGERLDAAYDIAFVMNSTGKTVETIR